jgi:hypothetical protein
VVDLSCDSLFYHTSAREALRQCLPDSLRDQTFSATIKNEESVQRWLVLLTKNLNDIVTPNLGNKVHSVVVESFGFTGVSNAQSANWNV